MVRVFASDSLKGEVVFEGEIPLEISPKTFWLQPDQYSKNPEQGEKVSARFDGFFFYPGGMKDLLVESDNGFRIYFSSRDGVLGVRDNFGFSVYRDLISLDGPAGWYPFTVEWRNDYGGRELHLNWQETDGNLVPLRYGFLRSQ